MYQKPNLVDFPKPRRGDLPIENTPKAPLLFFSGAAAQVDTSHD
jgi:hypothetical protein